LQAVAQPDGIELVDGECSHAALRASLAADDPLAGATGSISESSVSDLNEVVIAFGYHKNTLPLINTDGTDRNR
jgi:hypothetical protein